VHTFYNLGCNNNQFTVTEGADPPELITLTPGNYNSSQVETLIKNDLDAISANVYTVSVSFTTGLMTIVNTSSVDTVLDFDVANSASEYMGFSRDTTHTMNVGNSYTVNGTQNVNFLGSIDSIEIRCRQFEQSFITSATGSSSDVFYSKAVTSSPYDIEVAEPSTVQRSSFTRPTQFLHFQLTSDDGALIPWNSLASSQFVIGMFTSPEQYQASVSGIGSVNLFN
jgi:hypothetical protein